jgi:peptidoglycan hydrolase-like protein with peptidoglycan-binding domain
MTVRLIPRSEWGARRPKSRRTISTPQQRLIQHHTVGLYVGPAGMRSMQNFHMDGRGWADIAYSMVADITMNVLFEARGKGVSGAHTAGLNSSSHAISVTGNFQTRIPTERDLLLIAGAVRIAREQGWCTSGLTSGHRDHASTACPGQHLYSQRGVINELSRQVEPVIVKPDPSYKPAPKDAWYDQLLSRLPLVGVGQKAPRHLNRVVQAVLAAHRVPPANSFEYDPQKRTAYPDGLIGTHTDRAIKTFQERNGMITDGIVGLATLKALFPGVWPLVRRGSAGLWEGIVQALLAVNQFAPEQSFSPEGIPDRVFGDRSDKAVRDYQRARGLAVDGIVGQNTYTRTILI